MGAPKQKWTQEEEAALKAGVVKHGAGKWRTILKDPEFSGVLYLRSNVDLKDKWRNLSVMANGWGSREKARQAVKKIQPKQEEGSMALTVVKSEDEIVDTKPLSFSSGSVPLPSPKRSVSKLVAHLSIFSYMVHSFLLGFVERNVSQKRILCLGTDILIYTFDDFASSCCASGMFGPSEYEVKWSGNISFLAQWLDNLIMEAITNLKEPGGSNKTAIAEYIELLVAVVLQAKQKYRIPSVSEKRRNSMPFPEERSRADLRVERDEFSIRKSQVDLELAKMRTMTAEEAAKVAAVAVSEAEAAIAEAEEAEKEAEAAEAEAEAAQAFADAAMKTLTGRNPTRMVKGSRGQLLERDELRKDIEQLCMQQAGPSYLVVATKMHFQRTASLEQEIENLKKKLISCTRENANLQEELSEAYRIKGQLADLHSAEVSKNIEAEKQLKFFQGCVAAAFAERDNSLMEAEKAKEKEEMMSQKFQEFQKRVEELNAESVKAKKLQASLQINLANVEEQNETFKKVISKFYDIRHQSLGGFIDENWDDKCLCLLPDPVEAWTFNDPGETTTSKYISGSYLINKCLIVFYCHNGCNLTAREFIFHCPVRTFSSTENDTLDVLLVKRQPKLAYMTPLGIKSALESEVEMLRKSTDNLQNKLRVGLEIENHLKKKVRDLEKKEVRTLTIWSEDLMKNGISRLREFHFQCREEIINALEEGKCYLNSVIHMVEEKSMQLDYDKEKDSGTSQSDVKMETERRILHSTGADFGVVDKLQLQKKNCGLFKSVDGALLDASEALAQALQEKVILCNSFRIVIIFALGVMPTMFACAVSALLLLSQQEERHLLERNVNAALRKKIEELQRNLLQILFSSSKNEELPFSVVWKSILKLPTIRKEKVTNEKVKALMELAQLKQKYSELKEKVGHEIRQGKVLADTGGRRISSPDKEGKLRNLLKRTNLQRWMGALDFGGNEAEGQLNSEGFFSSRRSSLSMDFARMKIENATLKESMESMHHLISSVHRLRLSLAKAKDSIALEGYFLSISEAVNDVIIEANLVKTALGSSLPVSWSAEPDTRSFVEGGEPVDTCEDSSTEKTDSVSAAGFEMIELVLLAADVLKDYIIELKSRRGS
ncbi:SANT/Myb domain [Dillenia turbinata]|uniref:MYB transcription factor n=1 Tax=Dillenia turbinata TaxID=194707 RepID=A0AAN8UP12_9MAGN